MVLALSRRTRRGASRQSVARAAARPPTIGALRSEERSEAPSSSPQRWTGQHILHCPRADAAHRTSQAQTWMSAASLHSLAIEVSPRSLPRGLLAASFSLRIRPRALGCDRRDGWSQRDRRCSGKQTGTARQTKSSGWTLLSRPHHRRCADTSGRAQGTHRAVRGSPVTWTDTAGPMLGWLAASLTSALSPAGTDDDCICRTVGKCCIRGIRDLTAGLLPVLALHLALIPVNPVAALASARRAADFDIDVDVAIRPLRLRAAYRFDALSALRATGIGALLPWRTEKDQPAATWRVAQSPRWRCPSTRASGAVVDRRRRSQERSMRFLAPYIAKGKEADQTRAFCAYTPRNGS